MHERGQILLERNLLVPPLSKGTLCSTILGGTFRIAQGSSIACKSLRGRLVKRGTGTRIGGGRGSSCSSDSSFMPVMLSVGPSSIALLRLVTHSFLLCLVEVSPQQLLVIGRPRCLILILALILALILVLPIARPDLFPVPLLRFCACACRTAPASGLRAPPSLALCFHLAAVFAVRPYMLTKVEVLLLAGSLSQLHDRIHRGCIAPREIGGKLSGNGLRIERWGWLRMIVAIAMVARLCLVLRSARRLSATSTR